MKRTFQLGVITALLLTQGYAFADSLSATATFVGATNPSTHTVDLGGANAAQASYTGKSPAGSASASATLTDWTGAAEGGSVANFYRAMAITSLSLTPWNVTESRALTAAEMAGLTLSFDFRATGQFSMTNTNMARIANVAYSVTMPSAGLQYVGSHYKNCPMAAYCVSSPDVTGDSFSIDETFSLTQTLVPDQRLDMNVNTLADMGGTGSAQVHLEWLGTRLMSGAATAPLALRLSDGSLLSITSAVPESSGLNMMLAGLGLLAAMRIRRRQA